MAMTTPRCAAVLSEHLHLTVTSDSDRPVLTPELADALARLIRRLRDTTTSQTSKGVQRMAEDRSGQRHYEIKPKWHTTAEVAAMLGYSLSKTKMLVITGEMRSLKDGRSRRILPEWVDEYVARKAAEADDLMA